MKKIEADEDEGPQVWPNYPDALIGLAQVWHPDGNIVERAIYDGERILDHLVADDGMDREDALEFLEFNIQGGYTGPNMPIIVWPDPDRDDD